MLRAARTTSEPEALGGSKALDVSAAQARTPEAELRQAFNLVGCDQAKPAKPSDVV